jgi:uncharacterized protein (TIGR00369 family)
MHREDFERTPVNRWLGFRLRSRTPERVEIEQDVRPEMLQETGVVQGGLLTALADTAAVYLLWPDLSAARTMTGTTVSMQFLSGARPGAGPLRAVATPLRVGRRLAVCESLVHQGERLVCKGTFTFLLMETA